MNVDIPSDTTPVAKKRRTYSKEQRKISLN